MRRVTRVKVDFAEQQPFDGECEFQFQIACQFVAQVDRHVTGFINGHICHIDVVDRVSKEVSPADTEEYSYLRKHLQYAYIVQLFEYI